MIKTITRLLQRFWNSWGRDLFIVLAIMVLIRSSIADWNQVPTGSMKPTILEGDRIFVNKLAYDLKIPLTKFRLASWGDPERGDIVTFSSPKDGTRLVKRVVGLPGDTIEMRNNHLIINGTPAQYSPLEKTISNSLGSAEVAESRFALESIGQEAHPVMISNRPSPLRSFGPSQVPKGQYLMLGDNRDNSADSRVFGFVKREFIMGKSPALVISLNPEKLYLPRLGRAFQKLL